MNKKKSQEYLDKINQSFAELDEPAHEIDIETILGYIRIFYSNVKGIPVQSYNMADSNSKSKKDETFKKEPVKEKIAIEKVEDFNYNASQVSDNATQLNEEINNSSTDIENQKESNSSSWPVSESQVISSEIEDTFPLNNDPIIDSKNDENISSEEITTQEYIKTFEEEEKEEEIASAPIEVNKISNTEEKNFPVYEAPKIEPVFTPEVPPEVIKEPESVLTLPEIKVEKTAPIVESVPKAKETFLTKIEAEQSRTLYQPTGHNPHNPSDAIESLFKEKSPTGLVDFLGLSPLDNLNKAWGLNEKMLVIKDLFDDDFASFNDTVEMINKFTSFEEVKYYLINNVVDKYKWNDLSRFKKASDFIVQTKRLFVR